MSARRGRHGGLAAAATAWFLASFIGLTRARISAVERGQTAKNGRRGAILLAMGVSVLTLAVGSCASSGDRTADSQPALTTASPRSGSDMTPDLFSKLPEADAIGRGYRVERSSLTDPPEMPDPAKTTTTTATSYNILDKFCPGANWPRLDNQPDLPGVQYVEFVDKADREVSVGLAPVPPTLDRDGMARLLAKLNDCGTINEDHGFATSTHTYRADAISDVGDYGIDIHWSSKSAVPDGSVSMDMSQRTYLFVVNDTLVAVEADGGFDLDRMQTVSGDDDLVPLVSKAAALRLKD